MKWGILAVLAAACLSSRVAAESKEIYEPKVLIRGQWGDKPGEFGLGEYLGEWMSDYTVPREFAVDDVGNIYVMDTANGRIQRFDSAGAFTVQYPLEIFRAPTNAEYDEAEKTWNKRGKGFAVVSSKGLGWLRGQLYVRQMLMPNVKTGYYVDRILVLRSGKFVEASVKEREVYDEAGAGDRVDADGSRYRRDKNRIWRKYKTDSRAIDLVDGRGNRYSHDGGVLRKYNRRDEIVFEMTTDKRRGEGRGAWYSRSTVHFDHRGNAFYELRAFAIGPEPPFQSKAGGMEIVKWTLRGE